MDCRETGRKLKLLVDNLLEAQEETAVREHLSRCPECARLAAAEDALSQGLQQMRALQPPRPASIETVRQEIAIRDKRYRNTNLGVRIMQQVSDTISARPRLSLAAAAVLLLLAASVLVPVRTERPIGYELAFAAPSGFILNQQSAERVLANLDIDDARIESSEADSHAVYRISALRDSVQVRRLKVILDSLGGRHVLILPADKQLEEKTIWQLILPEGREEPSSAKGASGRERPVRLNLKELLGEHFVLWMPAGEQKDDSLRGLLMERRGEKTNIQLVGMSTDSMVTDCGLSQFLNGNTVMHTTMPNGDHLIFDLSKIDDVRQLEEAGYNFVLMKFDTRAQIPVPGMGPKLNKIDPNPFTDKTVIEYMIPRAYEVKLQILDEQGALVRSLLDCIGIAGVRSVIWDGLDDDGEETSPGVYRCRFTAGDYVETKQITFK